MSETANMGDGPRDASLTPRMPFVELVANGFAGTTAAGFIGGLDRANV